ncbi:MAG: hypothetical protein ACXVAY_16815 [Mucilaginibacter sp.]
MEEQEVNHQDIGAVVLQFKRRRALLPWWMIGCSWIFFLVAAMMPVAVVFGLLKLNFEISLFGLITDNPVSLIGLFLMLLFSFKGVTAFGLWTEKDWAIGLAKIDAVVSFVICCVVMVYSLFTPIKSIRLELILIIPYYYKLNNIQYDWENFGLPVADEASA